MSEEFKVGDVVVCVDGHNPHPISWSPVKNGIYRIEATGIARAGVWVDLREDPLPKEKSGWDARRFKHLPKADDTFINQMRSLKPAKEKTNV